MIARPMNCVVEMQSVVASETVLRIAEYWSMHQLIVPALNVSLKYYTIVILNIEERTKDKQSMFTVQP